MSRKIYTCLVERLVYDKLYKEITLFFPAKGTEYKSQDDNHLNVIKDLSKRLMACKPHGRQISINIEFENILGFPYPAKLTIITNYQKREYTKEIYIKQFAMSKYITLYKQNVVCSKYELLNGRINMYHKTQSWNKQTVWKINHNEIPLRERLYNNDSLTRSFSMGGKKPKRKNITKL